MAKSVAGSDLFKAAVYGAAPPGHPLGPLSSSRNPPAPLSTPPTSLHTPLPTNPTPPLPPPNSHSSAGRDPNWGRIAAAAGYSGVQFDQNDLRIALGGIQLMDKGQPLPFDAAAASSYMKKAGEVHGTVRVDVRAPRTRTDTPRTPHHHHHTHTRTRAAVCAARCAAPPAHCAPLSSPPAGSCSRPRPASAGGRARLWIASDGAAPSFNPGPAGEHRVRAGEGARVGVRPHVRLRQDQRRLHVRGGRPPPAALRPTRLGRRGWDCDLRVCSGGGDVGAGAPSWLTRCLSPPPRAGLDRRDGRGRGRRRGGHWLAPGVRWPRLPINGSCLVVCAAGSSAGRPATGDRRGGGQRARPLLVKSWTSRLLRRLHEWWQRRGLKDRL